MMAGSNEGNQRQAIIPIQDTIHILSSIFCRGLNPQVRMSRTYDAVGNRTSLTADFVVGANVTKDYYNQISSTPSIASACRPKLHKEPVLGFIEFRTSGRLSPTTNWDKLLLWFATRI
jgi:hypothetical protein